MQVTWNLYFPHNWDEMRFGEFQLDVTTKKIHINPNAQRYYTIRQLYDFLKEEWEDMTCGTTGS